MTDFNFEEWADPSYRATYDPDDDKVRIYTDFVDRELYDALKRLGFGRAPKQGCFFQAWSPAREDAALALCGEIEDEDTTVFDRAEDRAQRFATYSGNARDRAEDNYQAAHQLSERFAGGQPILVGHHSERKARKDHKRVDRLATAAVEEFDRSHYWERRAAGVLRHAEHKHDRGKVMRRVKKLEADLRKKGREKDGDDYAHALGWFVGDLRDENPEEFALDGLNDFQARVVTATCWAQKRIMPAEMPKTQARLEKWQAGRDRWTSRWIEHLEGQIAYWRAILEDKHGVDLDDQLPLTVGGWVRCAYGWARVKRVNKGAEGRVNSVSVDLDTVKRSRPGSWFPRIVQYDRVLEWSSVEPGSVEFTVPKHEPPKPDPERERAEALADEVKGAEIVVNWNPDYFATPPDVVDLMLNEAADAIKPGSYVLEPSAGDGRIVEAIIRRWGEPRWPEGVTPFWCEINPTAIEVLRKKNLGGLQIGADFLEVEPDPVYDAVVMNPPFGRRKGYEHVKHAWRFVKPGGVLVTILPGAAEYFNEFRDDRFRDWVLDEGFSGCADLPAGTFKEAGTNVAAHVLVMRKPNGNYEQGRLL